ncbi:unnamed protein product [Microthlaspi erraticum]|uniref:Uncharacterized protein n=1 Tax=Microthlaspi erraticum TaxID=1685480 RepID=A0A6D2L9T7_9BRAS|nr:unnamed protein product [Microthlaspi erraticum]
MFIRFVLPIPQSFRIPMIVSVINAEKAVTSDKRDRSYERIKMLRNAAYFQSLAVMRKAASGNVRDLEVFASSEIHDSMEQ